MPTFTDSLRSFWHDLTSQDRHASVDSPYRSGQHQPLPQNRHSPLTSVTTSAVESRTDLESPYREDLEAGHGFANRSSNDSPKEGFRKPLQRSSTGMSSDMEAVGTGEIQMQSFSDGLPPPPPVAHSWGRVDRWMEDNYEELWENLCEGATFNDVNELEHELDCTLPQEVRESLQIHDGQERGGRPTGVIFGCMLLDCEEILQEWQQWRTINEVYFGDNRTYEIPQAPLKAFAGSSSAVPLAQASQSNNPQWRQELQDKQDSQPPNSIQKSYAHPAWIPLARDWGGNNICVDLAPGPTGRWGQVILVGRDYDCKYVVSRSWAAFIATMADDMSTDKWFIDEDTKELKLKEFKQPGVEPAYIDILRWRTDQKYGRKGPKRPLRINSQVAGAQANGYSPYGSPVSAAEDRGRSPHRFQNGKQPAAGSPRAHMSSPLARVTEEGPQPLKIDTHADATVARPEKLVSVDTPRSHNAPKLERLVSVDTPTIPNGFADDRRASLPKSRLNNSMLSETESSVASDTPTAKAEEAATKAGAQEEEMKDVQI
ncbi:Cell wall assembly regulator [Saxophila tyrrhenica]|uniref:Cell wall assembly regulator n=1 Tax=Saxophila tyrrhenica TaxID=1690608 RepID=A0AAV9P7H5_9PEZI|nr:Cell wall assembly regulator [Saxophila tyrrhenica]